MADASKPDYTIYVNRAQSVLRVVGTDPATGIKYTVRVCACSTGAGKFATPEGNYSTGTYYEWCHMSGDCYARYCVCFCYEGKGLLFHSVPYEIKSVTSLKSKEYNKLGRPASSGCIRLSLENAKWIYENCKRGTKVVVYDNENEYDECTDDNLLLNPCDALSGHNALYSSNYKLLKPISLQIPLDSPNKGWDPTDTDPANPWLLKTVTIKECSIWSYPVTKDGFRMKKIPEGYEVTIINIPIQSKISDGKVFYRTIKGAYILANCVIPAM